MAVQHSPFILKVLSGANAGASVRLKQGTVVIGRSMVSDIILHDESVADRHLQLQIGVDEIQLLPLATPVFVDGVDVSSRASKLEAYKRINLGAVELVVLDTRRVAPLAGATEQVKQTTNQTANTQTTLNPTTDNSVSTKKWTDKTYLAIGLSLLLLGNLWYFLPNLKQLTDKLGLRPSAEQQAETMLTSLGETGLQRVVNPDGTSVISGYVPTTSKRNELIWTLRRAGINANLNIYSQEELLESAQMILRSMGETGIAFNQTPPGNLQAKGVVRSTDVWQQAKQTILSDVGGVKAIDDTGVQTIDSYMALFAQFVEKKGLISRLQITKDSGNVIVKGDLTQNEIEQLKRIRNEFIETYGAANYPSIVLNVVDMKSKIKLAIRSVSVGKIPYLVSKDGKKYMEGSKLSDNYFVKSIKPDHVVLSTQGMDIPFYYGIEEGK
jgi:type III secretion system YscD/HrpQ family protein